MRITNRGHKPTPRNRGTPVPMPPRAESLAKYERIMPYRIELDGVLLGRARTERAALVAVFAMGLPRECVIQ
jgi:hypothetical protein